MPRWKCEMCPNINKSHIANPTIANNPLPSPTSLISHSNTIHLISNLNTKSIATKSNHDICPISQNPPYLLVNSSDYSHPYINLHLTSPLTALLTSPASPSSQVPPLLRRIGHMKISNEKAILSKKPLLLHLIGCVECLFLNSDISTCVSNYKLIQKLQVIYALLSISLFLPSYELSH